MEREGVLAEDGTRDVPSLDKFEAQIAEVHAVEADVQAMPSVIIEGLLHITTQPLKQSLVVLVSKWIYLYTQSLQQRVRPRRYNVPDWKSESESEYKLGCLYCSSYQSHHTPHHRCHAGAGERN